MFAWQRNRYQELEEKPAVLTPLRPTSMLQPSHFTTPLQQMKYPVRLDFSHERFRLRSLVLLSQLKETALQHIDLSDNELQSLAELNRFVALKTLVACRNMLPSGPAVDLCMHRLTELDLSGNRLFELPQLKELVLLQVLNVSRNSIRAGWEQLQFTAGLQALDVSQNRLDWSQVTASARAGKGVACGCVRVGEGSRSRVSHAAVCVSATAVEVECRMRLCACRRGQ
ncbi:hypothetical protein AB1Y20_000733 [Prymnesium parvum]|uniref:Leucine-rich repeat-containing protein 51 n=1 Tax=Prymnesium parvum TaxID=97485 RepID=A0AB34KAD8_PRYPA